MRIVKVIPLFVCSVLFCAILAPRAKADAWNEKTKVTFNVPVEIPGKALTAGTYVFKLADSQSDRNIVEVWNGDQTHLIAIVMADPEYRIDSTSRTVMHFDERPKNTPMALDDWFYPGDLSGQQFIYPNWQ